MNYFNSIPMRRQLEEIGHCRFMEHSEFSRGVEALKGKKIVFVGCGAQGLHQGLDLRDSGLDVSFHGFAVCGFQSSEIPAACGLNATQAGI